MMSALDSSAALALIEAEPGMDVVADAIAAGAVMSTVNYAVVVTKISERGASAIEVQRMLSILGVTLILFDPLQAMQTGFLRPVTRTLGLSLGDRACLALAGHLGVPAITTDRAWSALDIGIDIQVIR